MLATFGQHTLFKDKKSQIRQDLLTRRRALSAAQIQRMSRLIVRDRLQNFDLYRRAEMIHCYVSLPKLGEVDTHELIRNALEEGKRVAVPVTDFKRRTISCSQIESFEDVEDKPSGLKEPKRECLSPVALELIDLVILPGVAFDLQGNRIGMGGGFYDRFLSELAAASRSPAKVALAYQFQILERIETEPQDVRVDWIITEQAIYGTGS